MMYPSFDHIIVLSHGRMLYKGPTAAVRTYVDQYLRRAVVTALHDAAAVSAAAPSAIAALPPMPRWCSPFAFFFDLMTRAPYDPASLPRCPSILLHRLQARAQQQARASAYPAFGDNSVVGGANGDLVGGIGQLPRTISADDLGFAVATRGADGQQLLLVPVPPAGAGAVSALDYRFFINELLDEKEVAGSGVLPEMAVCACFVGSEDAYENLLEQCDAAFRGHMTVQAEKDFSAAVVSGSIGIRLDRNESGQVGKSVLPEASVSAVSTVSRVLVQSWRSLWPSSTWNVMLCALFACLGIAWHDVTSNTGGSSASAEETAAFNAYTHIAYVQLALLLGSLLYASSFVRGSIIKQSSSQQHPLVDLVSLLGRTTAAAVWSPSRSDQTACWPRVRAWFSHLRVVSWSVICYLLLALPECILAGIFLALPSLALARASDSFLGAEAMTSATFFWFVCVHFAAFLWAEHALILSIALLWGTHTRGKLMSLMMVVIGSICFSGLLLPVSDLATWLQWAYYGSHMQYAAKGILWQSFNLPAVVRAAAAGAQSSLPLENRVASQMLWSSELLTWASQDAPNWVSVWGPLLVVLFAVVAWSSVAVFVLYWRTHAHLTLGSATEDADRQTVSQNAAVVSSHRQVRSGSHAGGNGSSWARACCCAVAVTEPNSSSSQRTFGSTAIGSGSNLRLVSPDQSTSRNIQLEPLPRQGVGARD